MTVLVSVALAGLLLAVLGVVGDVLHDRQSGDQPGAFDTPPPWWANGVPVPFTTYESCFSGCVSFINFYIFGGDMVFMAVVFFILLRRFGFHAPVPGKK